MEELQAIIQTIQETLGGDIDQASLSPKWQVNTPNVDLAFRLHHYLNHAETADLLLGKLSEKHSKLATFSVESGYLNLLLTSNAWMRMFQNWSNSETAFLQDSGLLLASQELPEADEKLLKSKDVHFLAHARALSEIPNWAFSGNLDYQPSADNLLILKEILRLGNGRAIGKEERIRAAKSLVLALRRLWQSPILVPSESETSGFRQQILRLGLRVARALLGNSILLAPVE